MEEKKKKLTGQQGELMRALNITMDDLIANDEGSIPDSQKIAILKRQSYQWQQYKVLTGIFATLGAVFSGVALVNPEDVGGLIAIGALFLLMAAFFGVIGILQRQRVKMDLEKSNLQTTQGIAVVNVSEQKSHLEINGLELNASPDVLRRVRHLDPYIIHYLPDSKVILSMEHIPESSNIRQDVSRLQDKIIDNDVMHDYGETDAMKSDSTS